MIINKHGFTLIEVLFAATISITILGAAFGVIMQVRDTSSVMEMRAAARSEAERAIYVIGQELGQASLSSLGTLPGASIHYRIPVDIDGDGIALDAIRQVEWSGERIIQRDVMDANHDGLGVEQLVLVNGVQVTVLANSLAPCETKIEATDKPGLWFEAVPGGVRVTVCTQKISQPDRHLLTEVLAETIFVRNP